MGHDHDHHVGGDADRRYLWAALGLLLGYMVGEVVVGFLAGSLALLADAAHMTSDAAAIGLALFAMRLAVRPATGAYTFGFKRAEILSAMANGVTLLLLAAFFVVEGIRRLIAPPHVHGVAVLVTAVAGLLVNAAATLILHRADRRSLAVEGSFQHILTDAYAFAATAVAGLVVLTTGWARADALASLFVAALMVRAGLALVRDSGRIVLEAAPRDVAPADVAALMSAVPDVVDVHDLHVWEVTSGFPALSAHVLVAPSGDCHVARQGLESALQERFGISHSTLQVDHADEHPTRVHHDDPACPTWVEPGAAR